MRVWAWVRVGVLQLWYNILSSDIMLKSVYGNAGV